MTDVEKYLESDYENRFMFAKNNEKSKTKPAIGDVVDIFGNYMFSFNDEPEENIRVHAKSRFSNSKTLLL